MIGGDPPLDTGIGMGILDVWVPPRSVVAVAEATKSKPGAGETIHVSRPMVGEHGAP